MFSAVKVNGRRLYDYARAGETVERPKRDATIYEFKRTSEPIFDAITQTQTFAFKAVVSKGTYIRTLAVDFGKQFALPSVMKPVDPSISWRVYAGRKSLFSGCCYGNGKNGKYR